tara:strand:+ start:119 stop:355 length:237 start_codon:yes stop_codon:yes gene_type:complete
MKLTPEEITRFYTPRGTASIKLEPKEVEKRFWASRSVLSYARRRICQLLLEKKALEEQNKRLTTALELLKPEYFTEES